MKRWLSAVLGAACVVVFAGCSDGEQPAEVVGTVVIDGKPLSEGEIIFVASDDSKTPVGGKIQDGKYAVSVLPGDKIVRILASRPTKKPDPVMGAAAREALIGEEFNVKSKLTFSVQPGKNENVNFEVKSLP